MARDETGPHDAGLVAYLDGALTPQERAELEGRLADDGTLRARLDLLARGDRPFRAAFDAVAAAAPRARLEAMLAEALQPQAAQAPAAAIRATLRRPWFAVRPAALAAGLALFALGVGAGRYAPAEWWPSFGTASEQDSPEAWRSTAADYLALTTSQTLLAMPRDQALIRSDLAVVGKKLGLDLSPDRVELTKLALMRVDLYHFRNAPLVQITYFDPENGPVALCILGRKQAPEAPESERRNGMNIAYWSSGDHAFMLVGRAPDEVLAPLATQLAQRLS